ncbi:unnamed protein product [Microthlaspi erraticum]|uniref:F-box domain-containing protein n=1 Tax=Microthlaspi erraticum TaxID=1685480 RepID=A0A6D2JVL8_9BRAS|nr:unnamed protein product [Microthlaspi erraticum]
MDLMEDIICRIPLKSMRAVRLTCTKWNTLSKTKIFTKMHFDKTFAPKKYDESESRMIVLMEDNLYLMSDVNDSSGEQTGKLTCLDEQVKISGVFHCEGLLLCTLKDDDTKVVVWNPYLGQTRWIEARYPHVLRPRQSGMLLFDYSLGYEDKRSCRNHKLLRFIDGFIFRQWSEFSWYEIYDFESGLWTTLDVTDPYWYITGAGVYLKGNTYFCATKRNSGVDADHIICFDYTRERFGPLLPLPPLFQSTGHRVALSCVKEEKIAALWEHREEYGDMFEIWITTMVEPEKISWSKFFTFDDDSFSRDIGIHLTLGSFYIDEVKKVVMIFGKRLKRHIVCIIENEDSHDVVELVDHEVCPGEKWWESPRVCSYVPSLAQIKEPKGGQRQKQSDLEKLRYDDMMSRLSYFESKCKGPDPNC